MSMILIFHSPNKVRISVFDLYRSECECVALTQDVKHETELGTSPACAILNLWLC